VLPVAAQEVFDMDDLTALFSPAGNVNPYPIYSRLREQTPVVEVETVGLWLVSRYDDVVFALKRPELFSSQRDPALIRRMVDPRLQQSPEFDLLNDMSIATVDPPAHTRLRKLINLAFTPRAINRLEARICELVRALLDKILPAREFDLIEALAVPLPVIVIAEMLGVDPARRADFKRWSDDLMSGSRFAGELDDPTIERLIQSRREFVEFFREAIELRRRVPHDDLLGDLVRAEVEREVLSPNEVLTMAVLLMIAGNETTTNLIGNAMAEILEHPEQLSQLRADPALIPNFIEEVLRFRSPASMLVRTLTEELTLHGITIPKGETVALLVASANRDPEQFPEPDRFDITRERPAHLAFGYGIHFCVGASLSRLEAKIAFEELFRRLPPFSREPGPLDWMPNSSLRGLRSLRLRFDCGG
jgi:cytochrome P450